MPASPFQASGETSPGKNDDLPRTIAGSTPLPLGRRSFAVSGPLAPVRNASYPVPVRRLTGSFHASFSVRLTTNALRFPSVPATRFREDFHLQVIAHAGPTTQDVGGPLARSVTDLAIGLDATIGADLADPATRILTDRPHPGFVDGLDAEALQGARLGVLTMLLGDPAEDQEHSRLVREALDRMNDAGAEIIDIEIPGLDSILSGSSLIGHEFKWDLIGYLAATPGAPVGSLQDILDRGLYHVQLEATFRRRAATAQRDSAAYQQALGKRAAARNVVLETMDERSLDAMVYPTIRRRASQIGGSPTGLELPIERNDRASGTERPGGIY